MKEKPEGRGHEAIHQGTDRLPVGRYIRGEGAGKNETREQSDQQAHAKVITVIVVGRTVNSRQTSLGQTN